MHPSVKTHSYGYRLPSGFTLLGSVTTLLLTYLIPTPKQREFIMIARFINDEAGASAVELVILVLSVLSSIAGVAVVGFVLYCLGVFVGIF